MMESSGPRYTSRPRFSKITRAIGSQIDQTSLLFSLMIAPWTIELGRLGWERCAGQRSGYAARLGLSFFDCPMPRKIRELIQDLKAAGWRQISGGKGSHRKFKHDPRP